MHNKIIKFAKICIMSIFLLLITRMVYAENLPLNRQSRFIAQLEFGALWQSRNDVQIPNTNLGTRFSLVNLVGKGPLPALRFYFSWNINERHSLRLLLAPLSYTKSGQFPNDVKFVDTTFLANTQTDATYRFNSWRLGYQYNIYNSDSWCWYIGFTAKIRDAEIELRQEDRTAEETDLGFVPLLHIASEKKFGNKWYVIFDLDGLAGGPGRAFDGALKIGYCFNNAIDISAGYRTLEGGADIEEVYNFAWLHYGVLSLSYRF